MRTFKTMKQAVLSLAVDYENRPIPMFRNACSKEVFKNPVNSNQYSPQWLRHHLYEHPNLKIFNTFLTVYPPLYDFKIKGYEKEFLADKSG